LKTRIPRGVLTAVTGVAGAGKSSLIQGCLPKAYRKNRVLRVPATSLQ